MGLPWLIPFFWGVGGAPGRGLYRCKSLWNRCCGREMQQCTGAVCEHCLPGTCRAQGQPCPRPVSSVPSPSTGGSVACPQGFCGCKPGTSISNWCRSECQHPAGSERLGSGSQGVLTCPGSSTADQGGRNSSVPTLEGFPALGMLCPWAEGTFGGSGGVVVFQGLGDKATLPPQDKPPRFPSSQGWRTGSGAWRRDGAPCGSVPGRTLTDPSLGTLC